MTPTHKENLGRLIAVYSVAPQYIQRAVIIAVLSFLFFIAMMVGFYLRQSFGYFLLATAFLIVYLVMMFSLFTQRRTGVRVFENGLEYKKHLLVWSDFDTVESDGAVVFVTKDGQRIPLPATINEADALARHVRFKISVAAKSD